MCGSRLARVARLAFGYQLQQSHGLKGALTHRTKPLGGMRRNLITDKFNLARGSRAPPGRLEKRTHAPQQFGQLLDESVCALNRLNRTPWGLGSGLRCRA